MGAAVIAVVATAASASADRPYILMYSTLTDRSAPVTGLSCGLDAATDTTAEAGTHTGPLSGGPVAATTVGAVVVLTCAVHVGTANSTHAGADVAAADSGAPSVGATRFVVETVRFLVPENMPVYVCTEVVVNGVTYYWDGGSWGTSNSAGCIEAG
jgi:hypothetical protein